MSKRCELQKEYYKEFGNYKGEGKYSDHYVKWLESRILALNLQDKFWKMAEKEKEHLKWLIDNNSQKEMIEKSRNYLNHFIQQHKEYNEYVVDCT